MSLHMRPRALPRQVHNRALVQSQQLSSGEDQRKLGEEGREETGERGDREKRGKKRGKRREEEGRKRGKDKKRGKERGDYSMALSA